MHCKHWNILLSECDLSWIVSLAFDRHFFWHILHSKRSVPLPCCKRLCEYKPDPVENDFRHSLHLYLWHCSIWTFRSIGESQVEAQILQVNFLSDLFWFPYKLSSAVWLLRKVSSATRGFQFESKSIVAVWNLSCACPKVNSLAIASSSEGLLSIPYLVRSTEASVGLLPEEEEKGNMAYWHYIEYCRNLVINTMVLLC